MQPSHAVGLKEVVGTAKQLSIIHNQAIVVWYKSDIERHACTIIPSARK
jgi:hypothetical protein